MASNRTYQSITQTTKALREMGQKIEEAAKGALKEGADIVAQEAKSRCPVGVTGHLRDSVQAKAQRGGASYKIEANAKNEKGIPYGQFVEYDPAINHPFLYPALDANRAIVTDKIANAVRKATGGH